jgi:iron-sulfur cluster assembly accessory protein
MSTPATVEPVVILTENAAQEIRSMAERDPANAGKHLRVYIEPGGCSGLQYGMTFDEARDGDQFHEFHGVRVLVDSFSAEYLHGAVVDFSDALTGGGFKITNPNARQACGCGKSFEA